MPTNKIQTGLRLGEPIYDKVRVLAQREQRSCNNLLEYIIQKYISEYEDENVFLVIPQETE